MIIKGFGCLDFDRIVIRNKQPITYLIIRQLEAGAELPEQSYINVKTFRDWDRANNLFGPIPLSLVIFCGEIIYAKRLSFSWRDEYIEQSSQCIVPNTGFTKL